MAEAEELVVRKVLKKVLPGKKVLKPGELVVVEEAADVQKKALKKVLLKEVKLVLKVLKVGEVSAEEDDLAVLV